VLHDNIMQTQALSIAERGGAAAMPRHIRLIQTLEASAAELNRSLEGLASDDVLVQRGRAGDGLERPELAVVMAYTKMAVYDALVISPVCDDPLLLPDLMAAFPDAMAQRFPAAIQNHRLRRELVATKLTNELINRGGLTLPFELAEELGVSLADVGGAFVAGRELFDFRALWGAIDTAEVPGPVQLELHSYAIEAMRSQMADLLRVGRTTGGPSALVARLKPGLDRLGARIAQLLRPEPQAQIDWFEATLTRAGAPADITDRLVRMHALDGSVGIGLLAADLGGDEAQVAMGYTHLGETLGLDWAKGAALLLAPTDPWERLLKAGLVRDFEQLRLDLMRRIVAPGSDPVAAVNAWLAANTARADRVCGLVARARHSGTVTTAMLAHVASQARAVLAG
jgi:glutamate dehydrogenase